MKRIATAFCGLMLGVSALASPAGAVPVVPAAGQASLTSQATPVWYRRGFYVVGGAYYYNGHR
ncbi:MAG: BA14K family protein, partial [Alphaproteobacteria bacterium]|nr:BA14K family protein [Alphaproteobacteria bacterium]